VKDKTTIGQFEYADLIEADIHHVPARIDTGARTSAIWASNIKVSGNTLSYTLFDESSPLYTGGLVTTDNFSKVIVASSNGHTQSRYKVPMTIKLLDRRIKTFCTLADRSSQAFALLIGRNTLRGKFLVDVQNGPQALNNLDQDRSEELQSLL
jgi:hypothetical protein